MDNRPEVLNTPQKTSVAGAFWSSRARVTILGALALVFIALAGYAVYQAVIVDVPEESPVSPYAQLEADATYASAETLLRAGEYDAARTLYLEALKNVRGPEQEAQILYKIALTETQSDPRSATVRLKSIVVDAGYPDIQRAYAAQRLGLMFYSVDDKDYLVSQIFADEPYATFYQEGDTLLALRRLFDYASTFYPLAHAELQSAAWYANEIKYADDTNRAELAEQYLPIIEQKLANADRDIERMLPLSNPRTLIPGAMYWKAAVTARLDIAGLAFDGERAFREALDYILLEGTPEEEAYARYGYAVYLFTDSDKEGSEEEARAIFQPVIENIDDYPAIKRLLADERGDVLEQKDMLVNIAQSWEEFKNILILLGWSEDDFLVE